MPNPIENFGPKNTYDSKASTPSVDNMIELLANTSEGDTFHENRASYVFFDAKGNKLNPSEVKKRLLSGEPVIIKSNLFNSDDYTKTKIKNINELKQFYCVNTHIESREPFVQLGQKLEKMERKGLRIVAEEKTLRLGENHISSFDAARNLFLNKKPIKIVTPGNPPIRTSNYYTISSPKEFKEITPAIEREL